MELNEYFMIAIGLTSMALVMFVIKLSSQLRKASHTYEHKLKLLSDDVSALCAGAAGVAGHLSALEQQVKRVRERQDQLDLRDPSERALEQASRMVRQGAGVDELVSTCGLVRAEAELLMLLHRAQSEPVGDSDSPLRVVTG